MLRAQSIYKLKICSDCIERKDGVSAMKGHHIEEMTHEEVKALLNKDTIVVLPVGGGCEAHGLHLPLGTDMYMSQYLADRVTEECDVITLPLLAYANYPFLANKNGSVHVETRTFIEVVKDICISFCRHGVRKFGVIDRSGSSMHPLYTVATEMNNEWNAKVAVSLGGLGSRACKQVLEQKKGSHACEFETSCMLYICPGLVHMEKAVEEYSVDLPGTFVEGVEAHYVTRHMVTKSGVDGNPTLATGEKGKILLDDMVSDLVRFIENFRKFEITTY